MLLRVSKRWTADWLKTALVKVTVPSSYLAFRHLSSWDWRGKPRYLAEWVKNFIIRM